jgi:hypothetical protein
MGGGPVSLYRLECDVVSGSIETVYQIAYKKGDEVIVLDVGIEPPEGFAPVDPEVVNE